MTRTALVFLFVLLTAAFAGGAASGQASEGGSAGLAVPARHTADQDGDSKIVLTELLRVIQFFNSSGFHCQAGTEDGYNPGPGDTSCGVHASDYAPQDWQVSLSELLRLIQFFNSTGYFVCEGAVPASEDGYCAGQRKNVVFLLLDALRADRVGGTRNGMEVSPLMASFAEGGARFMQAISPSSWTRPSMVALFTGYHADQFRGGAGTPHADRYIIPDSYQPMVEWLLGRGYDAWAVQTNGNCVGEFGFTQGYAPGHWEFLEGAIAANVTDAALAHVSQWSEPFFLYLHYFDPHGPYAPPAAYQDIFGAQPELTPSDRDHLSPANYGAYLTETYLAWVNHTAPPSPLSPNGVEAMQYRYDSEVRYLDVELMRLIGQIQTRYPNTVFVITADHGEALMERGIYGHGHTLFEEQLRVPLIVQGPGVYPVEVEHPVETLGLLPALAYLLNLPPEPDWKGRNWFTDSGQAPIFSHASMDYASVDNEVDSVSQGSLRYIEQNIAAGPQLYDLATDPGELNNLAASQPGVVAAMQALLAEHKASLTP